MPGPIRGQRLTRDIHEEKNIVSYVPKAADFIASCYTTYEEDISPLANFTNMEDLVTVTMPNGDVILRNAQGIEASFDVIGVVVSSCLEAPSRFPKSNFPFFQRWIKFTAVDDPHFDRAIDARNALYEFIRRPAGECLPPTKYLVGETPCFRPCATMLTLLGTSFDSTPVELPPLYDKRPFVAAMLAGHGKFEFTSDNEVLYFGDEPNLDGGFTRREICPVTITPGHFVQVSMKFRLLKQKEGPYIFRELLKNVCVLHDGLSMDISRDIAANSIAGNRKVERSVKLYDVGRGKKRSAPGPA